MNKGLSLMLLALCVASLAQGASNRWCYRVNGYCTSDSRCNDDYWLYVGKKCSGFNRNCCVPEYGSPNYPYSK